MVKPPTERQTGRMDDRIQSTPSTGASLTEEGWEQCPSHSSLAQGAHPAAQFCTHRPSKHREQKPPGLTGETDGSMGIAGDFMCITTRQDKETGDKLHSELTRSNRLYRIPPNKCTWDTFQDRPYVSLQITSQRI